MIVSLAAEKAANEMFKVHENQQKKYIQLRLVYSKHMCVHFGEHADGGPHFAVTTRTSTSLLFRQSNVILKQSVIKHIRRDRALVTYIVVERRRPVEHIF